MNNMRLVLFVALLVAAWGTFSALPFAEGQDARIVRLSPSAVRGLPPNLVKELQRRECTIPQETVSKRSNNVIKGEFAQPGQKDWAVLCSVQGVSTILVFWNGSEKNPSSFAPMEDRIYIQAFHKSQFWYARGIRPVRRDFILRHHDAYGGPKPPPIDHQGIEDMFVGKAAVVWFYYDGRWLKVAGGD